jgi:hypothetical protein
MSAIQFSELEKQFKSALSLVAPWSDETPNNDQNLADEGALIVAKSTLRHEYAAQNRNQDNEEEVRSQEL